MNSIPIGWVLTTIGELVSYIQRGKSPKYTDHSELPVINQKCIRWNKLEIQYLKYIHPDQFPSWDITRYIHPGDILWNSTGTGTVGRAYLVSEADCVIPKVVDSHVTIVRLCDEIDQRYVYNWIKGPFIQHKIVDMCDGSTNQIELSRKTIADTEIPFAPLSEQKRIADKLDAILARVDACRERLDRIPAILKHFRQAVLAAATSGKLTEDWRENCQLPFNWPEVKLADVASSRLGKMLDKSKNQGELTPYLRNINVRWFDFNLDNIQKIRVSLKERDDLNLKIGDVLICEGGEPGRCAVWRESAGNFVYQKALHRVRVSDKLLPEYLCYVIKTAADDHSLAKLFTGTTIKHLTGVSLNQLTFLLPTLQEQTEIVRRVEELFAYADRIEARYQAARARIEKLTPAVLAKAFRGELVPQDPNDEPASVLLERIQKALPATKQRGRSKANPAAAS